MTLDSTRLLLLETSAQPGHVGLADGPRLLARRTLESGRHQARDLAPAIAELLHDQGWVPRDLAAVVVSRGPGSYTGLRVGIMSAKTLAYATGCRLLAIDTFAVIAARMPAECERVTILADAQKESIYLQTFARQHAGWEAQTELSIRPVADWLAERDTLDWVSGPGLLRYAGQLAAEIRVTPQEYWLPGLDGLLELGGQRFQAGQRDDLFALEPLYLRASSAELQWQEKNRATRIGTPQENKV